MFHCVRSFAPLHVVLIFQGPRGISNPALLYTFSIIFTGTAANHFPHRIHALQLREVKGVRLVKGRQSALFDVPSDHVDAFLAGFEGHEHVTINVPQEVLHRLVYTAVHHTRLPRLGPYCSVVSCMYCTTVF
jgi:GUCT (NUC152) domain-containing protein